MERYHHYVLIFRHINISKINMKLFLVSQFQIFDSLWFLIAKMRWKFLYLISIFYLFSRLPQFLLQWYLHPQFLLPPLASIIRPTHPLMANLRLLLLLVLLFQLILVRRVLPTTHGWNIFAQSDHLDMMYKIMLTIKIRDEYIATL